MDTATRLTPVRFPFRTLAICAGAVLIHFYPALRTLLIYDRTAIENGDLWRLITGNFVHLSVTHLVYNLVAFAIVGMIIELLGYRHFLILCLWASVFIGLIIYYSEPSLVYFAGLSGVVSAAATYQCLWGLFEKGVWRLLCSAVLMGIFVKISLELTFGKSLLFVVGGQMFIPVPLSHLTGAFAALTLFTLVRFSELMIWLREYHRLKCVNKIRSQASEL
jgi:rhomboid family GlyGly-CTERM serine protease